MMKNILWATSLAVMLLASCSQANQSKPEAKNSKAEFTSLKDAYNQLSQIPVATEDTIPLIKFGKYAVNVENNVGASNLNRQQIENTGNAMFSILDRVPMKYLILGYGCNIIEY